MIADDFLRYMEAEREASPLTVKTYRDAIDDYLMFLGKLEGDIKLEDADGDVVRDWVEDMMERGYKATNTCKKLSAVNTKAKLYAYNVADDTEKKVGTATFDLRNLGGVNYNNANKSEALFKIFNGTNVEKAQFGYIIYYNNGANVTRFSVRIPVKVTYEWGTFKTYVTVAIHRTLGN